MAAVIALHLALALLASCGAVSWTSQDVSIPSTAPSGTIDLQGTLLLPKTRRPAPGVVLVTGSGPNNRWSNFTLPFKNVNAVPPMTPTCAQTTVIGSVYGDIAETLASRGFAVLAYDKRSCCKQAACAGCRVDPSTGRFTSGCGYCCEPGCSFQPVDANVQTMTDFIDDATAALRWMGQRAEVNASDLTAVGHSQGCNVVPMAAAAVDPPPRVLMISGVGRDVFQTTVEQLNFISDSCAATLAACVAAGSGSSPLAQGCNVTVTQTPTVVAAIEEYGPLLANGSAPFGMDVVYSLVGAATGFFWQSWYNMTNTASVRAQMAALRATFHTINSPTDEQVFPADYDPLVKAVLDAPSGLGSATQVAGATHVLTAASLSSDHTLLSEVDAVTQFLCRGTACPADALLVADAASSNARTGLVAGLSAGLAVGWVAATVLAVLLAVRRRRERRGDGGVGEPLRVTH